MSLLINLLKIYSVIIYMSNTNIIAKNIFRSTQVRGNFSIIYNSVDDVQPNVFLHGDLYLGREVENGNGTYTNTGGDIIIRINNNEYIISPQILSYLVNITSDVQTQLTESLDIETFDILQNAFNLLSTEIPLTYVLQSIYDVYVESNNLNITTLENSITTINNNLNNYALLIDFNNYTTANDINITALENSITTINTNQNNYALQINFSNYTTTNDINITALQNDIASINTNFGNLNNYTLLSTYNSYINANDINITALENSITTINTNQNNYTLLSTYNNYTTANDINITNLQNSITTLETTPSGSALDDYIVYDSTNNELDINKTLAIDEDIKFKHYLQVPLITGTLYSLRLEGSSSTFNRTGCVINISSTPLNLTIAFHMKIHNTCDNFTNLISGHGLTLFIHKNVTGFRIITRTVNSGPNGGTSDHYSNYLPVDTWFFFTYIKQTLSNATLYHYYNISCYIDGIIQSGMTRNNTQNRVGVNQLVFGGLSGSYIDISITELMIFNKLLSLAEINDLKLNQMLLPTTNVNLILYYRFLTTEPTQLDNSPGAPNESLLLNSASIFTTSDFPSIVLSIPVVHEILSSSNNINFKYLNYDYQLTPKIMFHLRNLEFDVNSVLSMLSQQNLINTEKLQYFQHTDNNIFFNENLVCNGQDANIILGVNATGNAIVFYNDATIQQIGDNVTNNFKNIVIANGSNLNGISSTQLNYLTTITSDIQTQINSLSTLTQHITVAPNDTYFGKNTTLLNNDSNFILGSGNFTGQRVLFYGDSTIHQTGDNVTNLMKNITIADGCTLNGITTTRLSHLTTISSNVQTQLTNLSNNLINEIQRVDNANVQINSNITTLTNIAFTPSLITDWLPVEISNNLTITHNQNYNETNNISNFKIVFKPTFNSSIFMEVSPATTQYEGFMVHCDSNLLRIKCGQTVLANSIADNFDIYPHSVGFIKIYFYKSLFGVNLI